MLLGLRDNLELEGYEVQTAADGDDGLQKALAFQPDLVILDVMLPRKNGFDVCRELRARSNATPVVMLTARNQETDKVLGLELGADDYVTKPFSPREVVARVRAVLRRSSTATSEPPRVVVAGDLKIDGPKRELRRGDVPVRLTRKEFDLLYLLASTPGRAFTRSELLEDVWDFAWDGDTATVTVHVRRLREKIEEDPSNPVHLMTVWGVGYRFDP